MSDNQGLGAGGNGAYVLNTHRVSFWGDENVLELDKDDGCTIL